KSLRFLEFPKIIEQLIACTSFSAGAELAASLQPSTDPALVRQRIADTAQALCLCRRWAAVPLGGIHDVRNSARRARGGGVLSPDELAAILQTLVGTRRLVEFLTERFDIMAEEEPVSPLEEAARTGRLPYLTGRLALLPDLEDEIARCIGEDGGVKDSASPALQSLRSRQRVVQNRVRERLEQVVRSPETQKLLQDAIVTFRNGRYVVPLRQEARAALPGIVHDHSASGQTLFVEPLAVVELNNQLRELEAQEAEEVERILRALSGRVAGAAEALTLNGEVLSVLDLLFAKAKLAIKHKAGAPAIGDDLVVRLHQVRHPLLGEEAVPIDVRLGESFNVLLITGPNTGGKTVALKTLGLSLLMAQSGLLPAAAEGSRLPVVGAVYADIGDEQSIEQSLSTFSSHMSNIVRILRRASRGDLVLLDEVGSGTDPTEGSALAMAILEELRDRHALVMATTHYSELKSFAYAEAQVENASVEFDVATLRPTYKLAIGLPGRSNAFEIARRLGLSQPVLARAKARLTHEELRADELIRQVEENRRTAEADRAAAESARREAESLRSRYEKAKTDLEARREEALEAARTEAAALLDDTMRQIDDALGRLRRLERELRERAQQLGAAPEGEGEAPGEAALDLEADVGELRRALRARSERIAAARRPVAAGRTPHAPAAAQVGDRVRVLALQQTGDVIECDDEACTVLVGSMRMTVPRAELELVERKPPRKAAAGLGFGSMWLGKSQAISPELDLRGHTIDEAVARIDKYLDDAVLAGLSEVRLIHGKGTGALRAGVAEYLRTHPAVGGFRLGEAGEGGDGVTVAALATS
ncbi:MAG TPA: endonuclease MutS2, partial [Limnochordia bacterium]|nr:endonuclease MutS2 [Limnochordia bacterium]